MDGTEELGEFLREVSNWNWEEFCRAEHDDSYSTNQAVIFALIRAAAMERMDAIRLSLHRLDGKLVTPIKVEYPKIFFLYPNATALEAPSGTVKLEAPPPTNLASYEPSLEVAVPEPETQPDIEAMSLREVLTLMGTYPRKFPKGVVNLAERTEHWMNNRGKQPKEIPRVKTVIAAHLLVMAQSRDIAAITEVFDQLDGKLVETFKVLGDDIFITNYSMTAPAGAEKNKDGILQLEATQVQDLWAQKLNKDG